MNEIELLSPAGSFESLIPAVRMGADAVYLGSNEFSARKNAKNFNRDELEKAVEYCHIRGVKVYLALNTLIKDSEMESAIDLAKFSANINIDALILQDIGLASRLRNIMPDMKLHGSTQMTIHTESGVRLLEKMGFSRVVLARELSKNEIKKIRDSCNIELEVFIHGAMCMSVSGQCYFSSILGGRSGNRGLCAQPCRLPFCVPGGTGYDLSLKDMSIIEHIKELTNIGVNSVKIEGRMKRPEYVAAAVNACRKAIDNGKPEEESMNLLRNVFSRSGFTDGYYLGKRGKEMFGIRSKEDVLSATNEVFSNLHKLYKTENQNIPIYFEIRIKNGEKIRLNASDEDKNTISVYGDIPEISKNLDIDSDRCIKQLKKTGNTPFLVKNVCCDIDKGLSVSASSLNSLRRMAIDKLQEKRKFRNPIKFSTEKQEIVEKKPRNFNLKLRARFPNCNIPESFKICELISVPLNSKKEDLISLKNRGFNICLEIPRVFFGREKEVIKFLNDAKNIGINHVWAGNLGAVELSLNLGFKVHGGFSLNIINSDSVKWAERVGIEDIETSFEMTLNNISKLGGKIRRGIIAYGRLPMMITRNCPAKNGMNCKNCLGKSVLTDRKGIKFPMICNFGCTEILNSVPLYMADRINEIKDVDFLVLRYTVENSVESGENLNTFNRNKWCGNEITMGLYYRDVD